MPAPDHGDPDELRGALGRTLDAPLSREQAMQIRISRSVPCSRA